MIADFVGYIAGILIAISFLPQVFKSYKTKSVKDLSLWMIVVTIIGSLFWLAYGVLINSKPVIVMNSIFTVVVAYQLFLKIKYEK